MSNPGVTSGLRLSGAPNFRDLGGYRTADGKTVKHGLVFRSGDSATLTEGDLAKLKVLAPKLVVDLRSNKESAAYPPRWPLGDTAELIEANIMADMRAGDKDVMTPLFENPTAAGAREMMLGTYRLLPNACGAAFATMATRLAQGGNTPTIFHCTYGRDRTGFFAAMLLHILGVPRETIIDDYLKSKDYMDLAASKVLTQTMLKSMWNLSLDDAALDMLGPPHRPHIEAALNAVDDQYGDADAYLRSLGINTDVTTNLRKHLVE